MTYYWDQNIKYRIWSDDLDIDEEHAVEVDVATTRINQAEQFANEKMVKVIEPSLKSFRVCVEADEVIHVYNMLPRIYYEAQLIGVEDAPKKQEE